MRYKELNEYQRIGRVDWNELPARPEDSKLLGQVSCKLGILDIFSASVQDQDYKEALGFWANLRDIKKDIGIVVLVQIPEYVILHHAVVLPEYARNGVLSEMIHFIIRDFKTPLLNDSQTTVSGEALLKSLNRKFDTSIVYLPTNEKFDLDDIGKAKTSDGRMVIDPSEDFTDPLPYDRSTQKGQCFFYLREAEGNVTNVIDGETFTYGFDPRRHKLKWSCPPRYFYEDDAS